MSLQYLRPTLIVPDDQRLRQQRAAKLAITKEQGAIEQAVQRLQKRSRQLAALRDALPLVTDVFSVKVSKTDTVQQEFPHGRSRPVERVRKQTMTLVKVRNAVDHTAAFNTFRSYRPSFSTSSGNVLAHLHKVALSKVNGEPVAYYLLKYRDRNSGTYCSSMYLYALRHGKPTQIQMLSRRDYQ